MKAETRNLLFLHIGILCISTSGVLGRSIDLPVPVTIAWRAIFGALFLVLLMVLRKMTFKVDRKHHFRIFASGLFMLGHWLTYFYALYYSNIAIAMLSIFTYPIITVFLEPIVLKTPFDKQLILSGLIMLIGLYFLTPEFTMENDYTLGVIFGVSSALVYTFRNLIMKSLIVEYNASLLMTYQVMWACLLMIPVFFFYESTDPGDDWMWIIGLGLITTAIGHTLFASSFRTLSLSTASIISMIQPIYGVSLGIIFLSEIPDIRTAFGGIIILLGLLVQNLIKRFRNA